MGSHTRPAKEMAYPQSHSCRYCKQLSIIYDGQYCFTKLRRLGYQQVQRGARLGCTLLESLLHRFKSQHPSTCQPLMLESGIMRDDPDFLGLEFEWKCRGECGTDIDWLYELQTVEIINGTNTHPSIHNLDIFVLTMAKRSWTSASAACGGSAIQSASCI
jgi:hypothetical protein